MVIFYTKYTVLNSCGMSNIWLDQNNYSTVWLSSSVEHKLKDQFFKEWSENMNTDGRTPGISISPLRLGGGGQ